MLASAGHPPSSLSPFLSLPSLALSPPHRPALLASHLYPRLVSSPAWLGRFDLLQTLGEPEGEGAGGMWGGARSHSVVREAYGSTGCVNAMDWEGGGQERLATAGDDTKICIWKPGLDRGLRDDGREVVSPGLQYGLSEVIDTGHRANIFSVKWAPSLETRLFSCAGDATVRVYDLSLATNSYLTSSTISPLGGSISIHSSWQHYDTSACTHVFRCHLDRVKRVATEASPDVFMTCGEDGTVRQHDLRTTHRCRTSRLGSQPDSNCPQPLASYRGLSLYSLSISKLRPHLFVVAGTSPYAYLHDRRMLRFAASTWGSSLYSTTSASSLTHCVRRFGVPSPSVPWKAELSNHIVATKLSPTNPRDLLVSYSDDRVYLFDTDGEIYERPEAPPKLPIRRAKGRESGSRSVGTEDEDVLLGRSQKEDEDDEGEEKEVCRARIRQPSNLSDEEMDAELAAEARAIRRAMQRAGEGEPVEAQEEEDEEGEEEGEEEDEEDAVVRAPQRELARRHRLRLEERRATGEAGEDYRSPVEASAAAAAAEEGGEKSEAEERPRTGVRLSTVAERVVRGDEGAEPGEDEEDVELPSEGSEEDSEGSGSEPPPRSQTVDDVEENEDDESMDEDEDELETEEEEEDDEDSEEDSEDSPFMPTSRARAYHPDVPMVAPHKSYGGHANSQTVKDVNFAFHGTRVVSGSDDGHFFVWEKETGEVEGIFKGDESVVNVLQPHPRLPLLAISGIEETVKLFGPTSDADAAKKRNKVGEKDVIAERNRRGEGQANFGLSRSSILTLLAARLQAGGLQFLDADDDGQGEDGGGGHGGEGGGGPGAGGGAGAGGGRTRRVRIAVDPNAPPGQGDCVVS
ncbi:hypothetical protein JCM8097_000367 [Rhodosporidiobolus ruineniae]